MGERPRFDEAPPSDAIDFAPGQPSADLLPLAALQAASARYFEEAHPLELNYGEKPGDLRFRQALAEFLQRQSGLSTDPDGLFLSGGNSQGLDFVCQQFSQPGDVVLVEDPSFYLAFDVFRDHGLQVVPVALDGTGFDLRALDAAIRAHRPRMVYTIPSFQNPTGQTLTLEKREHLMALSREHDFLVVADEVYQLLWGREPAPPSLGTMSAQGNVIALGSFSKIIAPGLRLGWLQTDPHRVRQMTKAGFIRSGGNVNHLTSHWVRQLLLAGQVDQNLPVLRAAYQARNDALHAALTAHCEPFLSWSQPAGGYFIWAQLRDGRRARDLLASARAAGTGFVAGDRCSAGHGFDRCLRLSFAHYGPERLAAGVARLAQVFHAQD